MMLILSTQTHLIIPIPSERGPGRGSARNGLQGSYVRVENVLFQVADSVENVYMTRVNVARRQEKGRAAGR